jgi:cytochrome c oxidase cbb3-type subunit 4
MQTFIENFIAAWWTPAFIAIFLAILAYVMWPGNRKTFDNAAKMPLRED